MAPTSTARSSSTGIPGVPARRDPPGMAPRQTEPWWLHDLRHVAAVASAGTIVGALVVGLGSRLAMFLLAALNPQAHGRLSDDGFVMGRFDLGATSGLLLFCTMVGVLGGLLYLALRPLRFGPAWFQGAAVVVGPAVVAAAALVHTDGIDFTILEPSWLPIALFTVLPLLSAWALVGLCERWLDPSSWFLHGSPWRAAPAALTVLLLPVLPLVVVGVLGRVAHQRSRTVREAMAAPVVPAVGRALLAVLFAVALVDLVRDTVTLL